MVLTRVLLSNDVNMACLQLALSTEKEEVICLLLGEVRVLKLVHIGHMCIPSRVIALLFIPNVSNLNLLLVRMSTKITILLAAQATNLPLMFRKAL